MGVLTIYLDKATDLTNKDFLSCSDPYVSFELEQDNFVRQTITASSVFALSLCLLCFQAGGEDNTKEAHHIDKLALMLMISFN